jgi:hypothetical protein
MARRLALLRAPSRAANDATITALTVPSTNSSPAVPSTIARTWS